jgi:MFS family permease
MASLTGYFRRLGKGVRLNMLVQLFSSFSLGFASYYFKVRGVEFYKLMMIWSISPLVSLPVVALGNTWSIKRNLRLGLLAYTGMSVSLLVFTPFSFLAFGIFSGLVLGFFWVSLNYVFFQNSDDGNYAKDSSIYFLLGPLAGIVLPPLGALVIHDLGFQALFTASAVISLIPLLYVRGHDFSPVLERSFGAANRAFSGLRLITFFDGALHFFQGNFLIIYALLYLKTEYAVGGLLSYLAFISLLGSVFLSHVSDRVKRRVEILFPLLILMAALIAIMPILKGITPLVIVIGMYAVLDNLSLPIRFAVPMDVVTMDIGFWRMSEFYGNTGRVVVFAIASLLLYFNNFWAPFVIFALMTLAFPFIISRKLNWLRSSGPLLQIDRQSMALGDA